MNNKKAACPAGTRTSGKDLENKENLVCEKNITTRGESQEGVWQHDAIIVEPPTPSGLPRSGKTQSLLQQMTAKYNEARRAVKIAARVINADGLCIYDTAGKCRKTWPPDEATCEKCIENWLLRKARKELRHG